MGFGTGLVGGGKPLYTPIRRLGERCKLPSGEFWFILGSSGELSCSPVMNNCVQWKSGQSAWTPQR